MIERRTTSPASPPGILERTLAGDKAEVDYPALNARQPAVALWEKEQLDLLIDCFDCFEVSLQSVEDATPRSPATRSLRLSKRRELRPDASTIKGAVNRRLTVGER